MWCSSPLKAIPAAALSDRTPHNRNRNKTAPFDGSIWITFCSGLRRISKTSCSISGPTSTTIAPIPQWKGERRICLRHDQSQISARFDGNLTVDPYIRHQWLRDFPKTLDRSGIWSTLGRLPIKSSGACVLGCCALRGSDRFTPTVSIRQTRVSDLTQNFKNSRSLRNSPRTAF